MERRRSEWRCILCRYYCVAGCIRGSLIGHLLALVFDLGVVEVLVYSRNSAGSFLK